MCFLLLLVIILSVQQASTAPFIGVNLSDDQLAYLQSTINNQSCEFYNEVEKLSPCGSQGYVQKFIYKYCMAYLNNERIFTNQQWQNGVRVCLQQKLHDYLESNRNANCSAIKNAGFDSHTYCYLQPIENETELTFCRLPIHDVAKIIWIAKGTIFEPAAWSQLAQLIKNCSFGFLLG